MSNRGVLLNQDDLNMIALGAPVLGTGGGGDPYIGHLIARQAIAQSGGVRMISTAELPNDALVIGSAMMGAPTVAIEKVPGGEEALLAFRTLEEFVGDEAYATFSIEAGGLNSMIPIATAAKRRIPLIDADCMGRAFPELQMVSPTLEGIAATPLAVADEKGNVVLLKSTDTNRTAERFARSVTIGMGGSVAIALYRMRGSQARSALIAGSISTAFRIGRALRDAWTTRANALQAVLSATSGFLAFQGKISDLNRRTEGGFARGTVAIRGTRPYSGQTLEIEFQNENLIATRDGRPLVSVPDLITVLDGETATPITTERLRYGLRVSVIAMPCDPRWRTKKGLGIVGPECFGYSNPYRPVEQLLRSTRGTG